MDEAGRLISELQQKLAQLDHKVWLYRQDMATEFKKHADSLLLDVPKEVSDTVNKAMAESLKGYPSLDMTSQDTDRTNSRAVNNETIPNCVSDNISMPSKLVVVPADLINGPESPLDGRPASHEREQEFQGIFTPGYLPLLDSTDRNERRSSSSSNNASPSVSEKQPINIIPQERPAEDTTAQPSSYPTSTSSSIPRTPPPRRRSTDDGSNKLDHSDNPVRRSALRRTSSSSKPHSPRHVRFEFAGEEYLPTSSPKLDVPAIDFTPRSPIILGMGGTEELTEGLESPHVDDRSESPPPKRITSSQALRLLSRGPLEDDGTKWTEVIAPSDGSASVAREEAALDDSDDESLSMPLSVTAAAARLNGHKGLDVKENQKSSSEASELSAQILPASPKERDAIRNGNKTPDEIAEEDDILSDMPPLMPVVANKNLNTKSSNAPPRKSAEKPPNVATKDNKKPWFILPDGTDLNDFQSTTTDFDVDLDEEDMFAFDEVADQPQEKPPSEPDYEDDSPDSAMEDKAEEGSNISRFATSPARVIHKPGTPIAESNTVAPSNSHRSSYHPFNTPIVNPVLHEQAASLGNVPSFVGSMKDGLEEMVLQSFRGGGSLTGGAPRSLSERMAFEEAMEARHAAAEKD